MADRQLRHLNRFRVGALKGGEYCLRLEPFTLPEKKIRKMRPGDWIDLGETLPALEVAREGVRIASAYPTGEGIRLGAFETEPSDPVPPGKRVVLEARLTVLPAGQMRAGALIPLSRSVLERVYLYSAAGNYLAEARLIVHDGGYALRIEEMPHG